MSNLLTRRFVKTSDSILKKQDAKPSLIIKRDGHYRDGHEGFKRFENMENTSFE